MKKFIAFLFFALFAVTVIGQTSATLKADVYGYVWQGKASDTLSSTYTLTKTLYVNKVEPYYVNMFVDADSAGDATDITVRLRGSWDGINFVNIGSAVTWYLADDDTTFSITHATKYTLAEVADTAGTIKYGFPRSVTTTNTIGGLRYPILQAYFLGAGAATDMALKRIVFTLTKAN